MLTLLFRDEHLIAVDKPAGLLVHRMGGPPEPAALQQVRDQIGQRVYPVHRLDRATAGVLLFALSSADASAVAGLFAAGEVHKIYQAVVRGHPQPKGTIDYPLVDEPGTTVRDAVTDFETLRETELPFAVGRYPTARYALIELRPRTGRTHQLRRHCAHLRHPIVGDVRHGDGRHNRAFREHFALHRMLLFARQISFVHPFSGETIEISANVDEEAHSVLERIGLAPPPPSRGAALGVEKG